MRQMLGIIYHAVDGLSLKLTGICYVPLMINASTLTLWMAGLATLSTIIYNSIRIYKELKNKKEK